MSDVQNITVECNVLYSKVQYIKVMIEHGLFEIFREVHMIELYSIVQYSTIQ